MSRYPWLPGNWRHWHQVNELLPDPNMTHCIGLSVPNGLTLCDEIEQNQFDLCKTNVTNCFPLRFVCKTFHSFIHRRLHQRTRIVIFRARFSTTQWTFHCMSEVSPICSWHRVCSGKLWHVYKGAAFTIFELQLTNYPLAQIEKSQYFTRYHWPFRIILSLFMF